MNMTLATTAAIALALPAAPALAEDLSDVRTVHVEYRDLNLATPQGQERLDRRIRRAARQVCGLDRLSAGPHLPPSDALACHRAALSQARQKVAVIIEQSARGG